MLTPIGNIHHHPLPRPGAIVRVRGLPAFDPKRRWRVESFPLTDAEPYRGVFYSLGVHTVNLVALDCRERVRLSGIWCEEVDVCPIRQKVIRHGRPRQYARVRYRS